MQAVYLLPGGRKNRAEPDGSTKIGLEARHCARHHQAFPKHQIRTLANRLQTHRAVRRHDNDQSARDVQNDPAL